MIRITSQDGTHQYDENGRAITTWDAKKCSWIVNSEFESESIDWYGEDSDFPAGCTLAEFEHANPNWEKNPDITVTWYWKDEEACVKAFGTPSSFGAASNYWEKMSYPYTANKHWGYLDYSEDEAMRLGKYCGWNVHADRVLITYNGKTIHDGKI